MPRIHQGSWTAQGKRFALIASRFNEFVCDKLIEGAVDALIKTGARDEDIEIYRCPGAFELPGLARRIADSGAYHGLVCLGVVVRGATPHFDVVVTQCTRGIAQIAAEAKLAVGFGVLTCDTIEQAVERAGTKGGNRGADAAMATIEMASLYDQLSGRGAATGQAASRK